MQNLHVNRVKNEIGRRKKRKFDIYSKKKSKEISDVLSEPPEIELPGNASEFSAFSSVRQVVLEAWAKKAGQIYLASSASVPTLETTYEADSDSDATEIFHPPPLRVPKVNSLLDSYKVFSDRLVLKICQSSVKLSVFIC